MGADNQSSAGVNPLAKLSAAAVELLKAALPDYEWKEEMLGAGIPAVPTGTVSAAEINFREQTKIDDLADISFSVYLIVPDSSRSIEEDAMAARAALDHDDLGGGAMDSRVKQIIFGTAPGLPGRNAGAALISYEVEAYL